MKKIKSLIILSLISALILTAYSSKFSFEGEMGALSANMNNRGLPASMTRLLLTYGILAVSQIVFFIFDIAICNVLRSSDAAIQGVGAFKECTLNTGIFGFLLIMELFQLLNTTVCFGVFYLISRLRKDLKKTVTVSAFVLMTAYVVKNSYPNVLAPVLFGICDYGRLFNAVF